MALSAAIILAAGEGTRMRSNKPKVLHTLAGKTFLNRVMDSVAALDPDTLAVVVHYQAERVAEAARSYNEHVTIVDQDDIPGTGRAVQCAMAQLTQKDDLDGAVLIAASDMPLLDTDTLDQLLAFHEKSGNGATVLTTILDDPTGYGRIIRDSEGNVLRIVEQKDANSSELAVREVNTSVYVFDAKLLAEAIANLKSNNAQGEFYLTDALEAAKANGAVGAFAAPDPLSVEGVNDRVQLAALAKAHNKRVCEHWMREGVTILDPDTTWIEDDVQIARDADRRSRRSRPVHHADRRHHRRRSACGTLPRAGDAHRPRRQHRPVDVSASGQRARRGKQGRRVRGNEEGAHRQRHEGAAPELCRRRRPGRAHQHRRRHHHRQL